MSYQNQDCAEFTKPSVSMTLYKKSTNVYLTLLHFILLNVHIDFISKKGLF